MKELLPHHGGPLHYLGNRYLTLPNSSGHMKTSTEWLSDIFSIIIADGKTYRKCIEPFAGSASFSLAAMEIGMADEYIINDSNAILVNTHRLIRDEPKLIKDTYLSLTEDLQKTNTIEEFFISVIQKYNQASGKVKSAILPFIINHSWGGMIYHNHQHEMIYMKLTGYLVDPNLSLTHFFNEVDRVSILLNSNKVTFKSGDFVSAINDATSNDFVILNPPYPENKRSFLDSTHMYTELYSPEELHEKILLSLHHFGENHINYLMTYGFYNQSMEAFVVNTIPQIQQYFYQLGYPECAFGMALDQIYLSSNLKVQDTSKFILRENLLGNRNLTESEALNKFIEMRDKKRS